MSNVISIKNNIDKLNGTHIVAAGKPVDEGAQACTVPVIIKWPDGEETNAYLKSFPKDYPASLVNEVTGFIVGKACGLPLPRKMGFLELPEDFYLQHGFLKWGVVVSELPGASLKSIWKIIDGSPAVALKLVVDRFFEWSLIENMLAFDDWMANQDRNIGNVIFRGPGDYSLIDHSDMPVKQGWVPEELDPSYQAESKLARVYNYPEAAGEDEKNKLRISAGRHKDVYNRVKVELDHWWKEALLLAGGQEFVDARLDALKHFVEKRAGESPSRIESNLTLLKAS